MLTQHFIVWKQNNSSAHLPADVTCSLYKKTKRMFLSKDLSVVGSRGVRAQRTHLLGRQFENPRAPRCPW